MKFLSVCSGIEAASLAWNPLGWKASAFSEIEPFPCALLKHRYPDTPNLGDMNNFEEWPDELFVDLLCGGTPCQSYSLSGLRKGLDDPRGDLMLVFGRIAAKYRPRWLVWENVPGVLSSNKGRDFAELLGLLTGQRVEVPKGGWKNTGILGGIASAYGLAWRVFDAQYAGLAQRRERVFLVGYLGDWHPAAAVLLERESLLGNPAPSRGAPQDLTGSTERGTARRGDDGFDVCATLDASYGKLQGASGQDANHGHSRLIAGTLKASDGGADTESARANHLVAFGGNNTAGPIEVAAGLMGHATFRGDFESDTLLAGTIRTHMRPGSDTVGGIVAGTLLGGAPSLSADADKGDQDTVILSATTVRRFTPLECERLQGMPDHYTLVPYRPRMFKDFDAWLAYLQARIEGMTKEQAIELAADGPRYKAIGNSWAVPCVRWIGERIEQVEAVLENAHG